MFWSLAYLVVRNLFALVWLLARLRRSKELEILVLQASPFSNRPESPQEARNLSPKLVPKEVT